uniref:Conidial yellow pigment biosynthesis polyketide synthase n=1 Tax=Monascus pilosus TaxID=89488 RepID=R9UNZ6_MONPI|nr:conidial yellow pigment biosynthesis polyketide synthase [Monascus pilosus]
MVSRILRPVTGSTVLLFGPQALSFTKEDFNQIRTTVLETQGFSWIVDAVAGLPGHWKALAERIPKLQSILGEQLLENLKDWFTTGQVNEADFHLPNILLSPLVVITQLAQYCQYLELSQADDQSDPHAIQSNNIEALGFCTGLLSAVTVACSTNRRQFQKYGAVAIRLAMLVGAAADAEDALSDYGASKSMATAWNSPEAGAELSRVLQDFPEAYVSVWYDANRVTVTTAAKTFPALQQKLRLAGIIATEVGLRGRFHCDCYGNDIDSMIDFCDSHPAFQFPDASELVLQTRSNAGGNLITKGNLHQHALRLILLERSQWYQTFSTMHAARLQYKDSVLVSFGPERCIPPSLLRGLSAQIVNMADLAVHNTCVPGAISTLKYAHAVEKNDIAVIGMSCKVAGADDLEEFWKLLCKGESQHQEVPKERFTFDTVFRELDTNRKWFGNFIRDHDVFDHKFFKKSPREIASTDPQQRHMLQIAYQAVEQSGYFCNPSVDKQIGCYIGVCAADYENNIACHAPNAFSATGNLKSFIAGKISHYFGWTGPGLTIDTACSSSAVAVHQACKAILSGECTAALAGGTNVMTHPLWFQNLAGASFLSPTGQCKPFDAHADGYCRGEGIAAVFLKKLSTAIEDGDQILGTIASTAVYQNQNCTPIFVPNSPSLSELFKDVTREAHLVPKQITVVEAHGTGTPVGDPAEYESILGVLGGSNRSTPLHFGSVKGLIGHTECTSGVISLIKVLLMINEGYIPPQASFTTMNPSIKALPEHNMKIATKLTPWNEDFRAALINNYGASGSNASLIVTQAPSARDPATIQVLEGARYPFWFPGPDDRSLRSYASRFLRFIQSKTVSAKNFSPRNLSFNLSRQSNRTFGRAAIFNCASIGELEQKLTALGNGNSSVAPTVRPATRPVVLCFGGQISTFVGLDRQLYDNVVILRSYLDRCDAVCRALKVGSIYPAIFERNPITDPVKLQTSLFAIQYSCAKSWIDCGVQPVALVGHSFGELTAVCISGILGLEDALKMIIGRASLIRDSWGDEKGSMMAIEADLPVVEKLLGESEKLCKDKPATIACFNGPRSFTLAGSSLAIDAVLQTVSSNSSFSSLRTKKLNVTNAFHSTLVEPLVVDLEKTATGLKFGKPIIHLERATESHSDEELTPKYVASHMRDPVYFNHAVQRLAKQHPSCVWLEAGCNSTIVNMLGRALGAFADHHFQPVNLSSDHGLDSLSDTTVSLWRAGLNVSFWSHHSSQTYEYANLLLPPYQFEKARHWVELKPPPKLTVEPVVQPASPIEELPKGLLTFVGYQDKDQRTARFRINTMVPKYEELVSGHLIAQTAPICPATLEVDLAIEALYSLRPDLVKSTLQPQIHHVDNQAPICVNPERMVWLQLEAFDAERHSWNWKIESTGSQKASATTLHVTGKVFFRSVDDLQFQLDFARYERLVGYQRCLGILNSLDADDIIQGRNIYKTFAEIVDYGEMYRGLQKLVGQGNESAGRIVKRYSGETWLDTHLSDCFSQVGGIWVNCMTDRVPTDMYIANGFEQWLRSPKISCDYERPEIWDVYAYHHRSSEKAYITDIFIFDSTNGLLTEVILGINYAKVPKMSMSKLLSRLTADGVRQSHRAAPVSAPAKLTAPAAIPGPASAVKVKKASKPKKKQSSAPDISGKVRAMLAELAGLEPEEIKDDTELANIGIDSLMGMELAREIEVIFKCSLPTDELVEVTSFQGLLRCIQEALGPSEVVEDTDGEEGEDGESSENPSVFTPSDAATSVSSAKADVAEFLAEFLGIEESDISPTTLLRDLGVDSLLSTELISEIASKFDAHIDEEVVLEELSVREFDVKVNGKLEGTPSSSAASTVPAKIIEESVKVNGSHPTVNSTPHTSSNGELSLPVSTVLEAFGETKALTDQFISDYHCANYIDTILPKQDQLCVALVIEAFEQLGCSLRNAKSGQTLERIKYLPQHERLVEYLYMMLEKGARLVDMDDDCIIRTAVTVPSKSSSEICQELMRDYPGHNFANQLTQFCGTRLADVLTGKLDGIKLIFGSEEGRTLVSGLYGDSLLNKLAYKQMEDFLKRLISKLPMHEGPLKILEMGAGTGGTTKWIVPMLASLNVPIEYTFTDLAPSFVAAARKKFKQYPFMKFRVHDIEKAPADDLVGTQHIILASNAVHATHSLTVSTSHIHKALRQDGFLMMLEMTETVYWIDIIFGLLEGWWLFDDGRRHAISHQSRWERDLNTAGFGHVDWTDGHRSEVNIQRIFLALASGQRYERQPVTPSSAAKAPLTDFAARQVAVLKYVRNSTQGFVAPTTSSTSQPKPSSPPGRCVLVTGATGSLGSHLVSHFAQLNDVTSVVCINRVSREDPTRRQQQSMESKGISLNNTALSKLIILETDTSKPMLGLPAEQYQHLVNNVTHVLHNAWPMSGKRPVKGFELQFQVMKNLITLAWDISCRRGPDFKVRFQLISSISVVGYYPLRTGNRHVPEERVCIEDLLPNGYSDAKYVCELMLDETLHQYPDRFSPMAVRLGQVAGSKTSGYWNPMEHLSFLMKSSQTLKALPDFEGELSWTPVNDVAGTLADLLLADNTPYPIYHIDNPVRQPWREMIPILADGLDIPKGNVIPFPEWVQRVRRFPGSVELDNPAAKLIDFLDDNFLRMSCGGLLLDTSKSREHSPTLADVVPVSAEAVHKYIQAWKEMGFLH